MHVLRFISALLIAAVAGCTKWVETDEYTRPTPGSNILVEPGNTEVQQEIMENVKKMLFQHPDYWQLTLSQGASSPTGYCLHFQNTCADHPDLVAAVRTEIAKSPAAPVRCTDKLDDAQ